MNKTKNAVLVAVLLVSSLLAPQAPGQLLVLDEPLQGGTQGTRGGGAFVAGGWQVTGKADFIYWHIPTITQGAVEWSVRGLLPNDARPEGLDKNEIFHMYDWTFENADTNYSGYRNNPYKHFVRKINALDTVKVNALELLWQILPDFAEPDSPALSWDPNTTYRFRQEWGPDGGGNSFLRTYRDGVLLRAMAVTGNWNPSGHAVRIAGSPRAALFGDFGASVGAIYSDVKVWDLSQAPPPPPPPPGTGRTGRVQVVGNSLVDDGGPFLGLGATYMSALWRSKNDPGRLNSDLAFLAQRGFNYYRMLSMVGHNQSWDGIEIAPVAFVNEAGKSVPAWPDYWQRFGELIDTAFDQHGLRTQITIFADAQLMPSKSVRIAHMARMMSDVIPGREHKIILIEVANEGFKNGFPGSAGIADMREFAQFLAARTSIPIAISAPQGDMTEMYANSEATIATEHFSRNKGPDGGWLPVHDSWRAEEFPGVPPVSNNEPIGPGSSVSSENDPIKLVMGAGFAYVAKLPMSVFHSAAGTQGRVRFEDMSGINNIGTLHLILPPDVASWARNDGRQAGSPFTFFANGQPNQWWTDVGGSDGAVRTPCTRKNNDFVCAPIGILGGGLELEARETLNFSVYNPLTGEVVDQRSMAPGQRIRLAQGPGAYIITNVAASSPPPSGSGGGLTGEYFDNMDFTARVFTRTDPTVNFEWGGGSPAGGIGAETFSVRWTGQVEARYSETYTFYTQSDDGVRLWVNGQLLIDNWTDHSTLEDQGTITLEAGRRYDIRMEYYENVGGATAKLLWSSPTQVKEIIPRSQLFPLSAPGNGTGLLGQYFDNMDLTAPVLARTDPTVNFDWGGDSPASGIDVDTFSVRWSGQVQARFSENYTFYTHSDDGVRLWVNGQLLIDNWTDHGPTEDQGTIALEAGRRYDILMEFYENGGGAMAKLLWSSPSQLKGIIPQSQLFPTAPPPPPPPPPATTNAAQFVSQSVPASMVAGQSYAVSVTMQNSGTSTWTAAGEYKLGSQNPQDNLTWGGNRVNLEASDSIAPNQSKTFQFTVTAPATPGTYDFQARMVREGVEWFGDSTPNVAVTVTATPPATTNTAQFEAQSVPASMVPGQSYPVSVTIRNSGTSTWTAAGDYKLGSQNPANNVTWGGNRAHLEASDSIAPGQSKTFTFTVTAPAAPGIYAFQWQMLRENVEWFGELTTYVPVTVGDVGSGNSPFGVVSAPGIGNDPLRQEDLKNLGVGWVRVSFGWHDMERTKGNIEWELADRIVNEITGRGVNIYWDFGSAPCWANGRPQAPGGGCLNLDDQTFPPLNQQDLYDFVHAVVSRYKDRVHYWGHWNEVNLSQFYKGGVDRFVANELQTTVNAIKAADPTAKVVVGELSSSGNEFPHLKKILDAVQGRFDVISHHVYDGGDTCGGRLAETIDPLRDSLVSWGYGAFPLWVTETGMMDSEARKSSYLRCFYDGMSVRPWWAKTFWYRYEFEGTSGSSWGLLDGGPDVYTPNETYFAYQTYISGPVTNTAAFASQNVPASMLPGQTYTVSVTMQNTGTSTWAAAGEYKLGSQNPQDNGIWGLGRVELAAADRIGPNQSKTFQFTVMAPSTPGTYNFQWRMLRELVEWFGEFTPNVTITVGLPAPTLTGIFPASGTTAGGAAVTITGTNFASGATVTFGDVAATNVVVASATTLTAVIGARAAGAVDVVVRNPDGQSATLTNGFTYVVPPPVNAAQFVSQSVPATMVAGQSYAVSVTMQNRGTLTWTASSHRLGSQNPQDNVTWGGNRVYLAESESIAPNESKTFEFTVIAPTTPGTYDFQGRMVHEGVEWFGEFTPNVVVTVSPNGAPPGTGTGLTGQYFNNIDFTALALTRTDATVHFDWGGGAPAAGIGADTFSVRWTGQVEARYSESYTFYTHSDDGVRLWVNGQLLIDNWTDHGPMEDQGTITLAAGQRYDIRMEFYENGGGAMAKLLWSSASQPKDIIAQSQLYPAAVPATGTGTGLTGQYFNNMNLTALALTRTDATVNFDWGGGSPAAAIGADTFSVRWTGQVQALYSEPYTFYTHSDDGVRLWVNGQLLIDNWTNHGPTEDQGAITLAAGQRYDIRMEFYENGGGAMAKLLWSSASQPKEIIPQSQLYPAPVGVSTNTVHFRALNGQYLVAEGNGGGDVNANRDGAGSWETFTLTDLNGGSLRDGDTVTLRTGNGAYLRAEGGGGGRLLADGAAPGAWETFAIIKIGDPGGLISNGDRVGLRTSNNHYLVAEGGGGDVVNANRPALGPWETFTFVE